MSDQHYLMTEEQIQFLKDNDIPYCPTAFRVICQNKFRKYLKYMQLCAYRNFGWEDSELLEETFSNSFKE